MCSPTLFIAAASVAVQLYSGQQQQQMAKHQARVAEDAGKVNAANQKNEATRLRNIGTEKENDHRRMVAEMQANQKAGFGASGVQVNTGSALQIQEDTGRIGEVDALRIRSNYNDQAEAMERGAELTRINASNDANIYRAEGKSAMTNSVLSAAGTVASSWYSPKSAAVVNQTPQTSPQVGSTQYWRGAV